MDTPHDFALRLQELLRRERVALAEFLVALAEFDRRRLWTELGYSSLFDFLHRELGLSKGAAFYRKSAVDLLQRFPDVVDPLRDGRLCLMSVVEVARVLTAENRDEVLPRFFHLSKREAQALAAALLPDEAPPRREVVTPVRGPAAAPMLALTTRAVPAREPAGAVQPVEPPCAVAEPDTLPAVQAVSAPAQVRPASTVEPLTADLSRLHVTVSRRFLDKLDAARAALSHSRPGASADEILEAGLDLLIDRHAKRRGLVSKPRRDPPAAKPDHVPAHVSRAVWQRDGGRCQWPVARGGICGSTHEVEIDHARPRARGGPATIDNLRLLCRFHNDLAAREVYGDAWMDRFTGQRAGSSRRGAPPP